MRGPSDYREIPSAQRALKCRISSRSNIHSKTEILQCDIKDGTTIPMGSRDYRRNARASLINILGSSFHGLGCDSF